MRTILFLSLRYLFKGKAKHISFISIISCLAVAVGISTLIIVISVMNGFDKDLMNKLLRFNYHLTVENVNKGFPQGIVEKIREIPGIESANFYVQTQVFAQLGNLILPLFVRGIEFHDERERKAFYRYVKEEKNVQSGFFIGEGLKKRFCLGEKIQFYPLKRKFKLVEGKVRGVFKVGLYDLDNSYLVCSLEKAKSLSKNYLLVLGIRVSNPFKIKRIKEKISSLLGEGFIVSSWMDYNHTLFSALKLEKITMFIILSLIVLVASFNIFATLTVKVVEKTKDIGVLRALGFNSKKVLSIFSLQGGMLGIVGVLLGVILGVGISLFLKKFQFIRLPQEIYYIEYLPVSINYKDIILISSLGILLSFFSSFFPARKASKFPPSEALRYE
ncbi:MAG: hypothetical protein B6D56_04880 [Candidatus Omnitrophica bacterium 4484_70.1]|nr:MAG: hypothetical protein B6D56_04880 [Candidatus Omnitrophica bacterium 4484_70.1]